MVTSLFDTFDFSSSTQPIAWVSQILSSHQKMRQAHILSCPDEEMARTKGKEPLGGLGGPMSRARTKKAKEDLQQVLTMIFEFRPKLQVEKLQIVN
ncbi:hypothetical protein HKD37_05G012895 [Glycine soja]